MKAKWKQLPVGIRVAIITGVFGVVIALITGVFQFLKATAPMNSVTSSASNGSQSAVTTGSNSPISQTIIGYPTNDMRALGSNAGLILDKVSAIDSKFPKRWSLSPEQADRLYQAAMMVPKDFEIAVDAERTDMEFVYLICRIFSRAGHARIRYGEVQNFNGGVGFWFEATEATMGKFKPVIDELKADFSEISPARQNTQNSTRFGMHFGSKPK